jgi:sugar-specific transcriptional regulator TrmB
MKQSDRIEILRKLGFSEYEAKCYLALFGKESLRVNEVAAMAEIPRPNAYEALRKLLAKGLCVSLPGGTRKYAAADPRHFKDKSLESLSNSMKSIDGLYLDLDAFFKGNCNNNNPLDYIKVIKDRYQIHHKYIELCSKAEKEILSFTKPPYVFKSKEQYQEQCDPQYDALKRGVKIKTIFETPVYPKEMAPFIQWMRDIHGGDGDEIKMVDSLPIKLAIFDDRTVLFVMPDPILEKLSITTVVVDNPALAMAFKMLFNSVWVQARDYIVINNRKNYIIEPLKAAGHQRKRTARRKTRRQISR